MVTSHSVALTGLNASTAYEYQVKSKDAANNLATQSTISVFTTLAPPPATAPFQESGGLLVIEAEHPHANISRSGKSWTNQTTQTGFAGEGYFEAGPDTNVIYDTSTGFATVSPELQYQVQIQTTGTYYVWVRGYGKDGGSDSVHVGLDGVSASSDRLNNFALGSYSWTKSTWDSVAATVNITTAGTHTLNVWMREDGFIFDKIILTQDPNYIPSGVGPQESARVSSDTTPPTISAVASTSITSTGATINWTTNEASDSQVEYRVQGTTTWSANTLNTSLLTAHSMALTGLAASTTYEYQVKSKDAAGNPAPLPTISVFTTLAPPAPPTVDSFPSVANRASLVLSGSKNANTSLWINGIEVVSLDAKTIWYAVVSLPVEGRHVFNITSRDIAGTESNVTSIAIELDKTVPQAPSLSSTTVLETNHEAQTIYGMKEAGTAVILNGAEIVPFSGNISWSAKVNLNQGNNVLTFVAQDEAGNLGLPSFVTIKRDDQFDASTLSFNFAPAQVNQNSIILSGAKQAGSAVTIVNLPSGNVAASVVADLLKTWQLTIPLTIEGENKFEIRSTEQDTKGIEIARTISFSVIRDTVQPPMPGATPEFTSTPNPTVSFSGTKESGSAIWINGSEVVPADPTNQWQATVALPEQGFNNFQIVAKDQAGNLSVAKTISIERTSLTPSKPVVDPVTTPTNAPTQTLAGTKDAGTAIFINGELVVPVNNNTSWTADVNLSVEGSNRFDIAAINSIGVPSETKTIFIHYDKISPTGAMVINHGAEVTRSAAVTLSLTAGDLGGSGVGEMSLSTGGINFSEPEPFSREKTFTLSQLDEVNHVYVKVRDKAGNWSAPASASIVYESEDAANFLMTSDPVATKKDYLLTYTYGVNSYLQPFELATEENYLSVDSIDQDGIHHKKIFIVDYITNQEGAQYFDYDANGNMIRTVDENGQTTSFLYDTTNHLKSVLYADNTSVKFEYDANGNRTAMVDSRGRTEYTYDWLGRLTKVTSPEGRSLAYEYDVVGNITAMIYPNGIRITYEYDGDDRLIGVTDDYGKTSYTYNAAGDVVLKVLPNGVRTTHTYDAAGRLTDIVNTTSSGVLISSVHYDLDANGNRTKVVITTPSATETTTYAYDSLNRLTQASYPDGQVYSYTYDGSGNRLTMNVTQGAVSAKYYYTYGTNNQLVRVGLSPTPSGNDEVFYYDRKGNLVSRSRPGRTVLYAYDAQNRLIQVVDNTHITQFLYDGDGNRVAKIVDGVRMDYVTDINRPISQVLQEINAQTGSPSKTYTFGNERIQINNSAIGRGFYLSDGLGSTTELTNVNQGLAAIYRNDAWGAFLKASEALPTDFLFAGEEFDRETGLYFLRNRYYDPLLGRFISKDPVLGSTKSTQSFNPYPYVQNNPVNFVDPNGLESFPPIGLSAASAADEFFNRATSGLYGVAARATRAIGGVVGAVSGFQAGFDVSQSRGYDVGRTITTTAAGTLFGAAYGSTVGSFAPGSTGRVTRTVLNTAIDTTFNRYGSVGIGSRFTSSDRSFNSFNRAAHGSRGGILLNKTAELVGEKLSNITGVVLDPISNQLVLTGASGSSALSDVIFDDLVVALKAVFGSIEDPGVTIREYFIDEFGKERQDINLFGGVDDTEFGQALIDADLILKKLSIEKDNVTGEPIVVGIQGYKSELDLYAEHQELVGSGGLTNIYFTPKSMELGRSANGKSFQFQEASMEVLTETRINGNVVPNVAVEEYAQFFTEHFDEFALEFPILERMRQGAKAVALARFIKDNNIPIDLSWLDSYELSDVTTPTSTPVLPLTKHGLTIKGGVALILLNKYLNDVGGKIGAFENTVLQPKTSDVTASWDVAVDGQTITNVAFSSDPTRQDSNVQFSQEDLSLPTPSEFKLGLTRYYDSLDVRKTNFGFAWQFLPYQLKFNRPAYVNSTYSDGTSVNGLREGKATLVDRLTGREAVFESTLHVTKAGFGGVNPDTLLPLYVPIAESDGSALGVGLDRTYTLTQADGSILRFDTNGNMIRMIDSKAHTFDYHYSNGKLTDVTDFLGRRILFTYDASGRVQRADGPLGFGIVYGYDAQGNLTSVFNEHTGETVRYSYDADHRITQITDPSGRSVLQAELDVMGRTTNKKDDRGNIFYVTRTSDNKKTITTDPVTGNQITEEYDSFHRLVKRTDYLGHATSYRYLSEEQKPFSITNPKGFTTYFFYDQNHNVTDIFDFENNVHQTFEYDERNNLIASTDRNGVRSTFVYDVKNNLIEIRRPINATQTAIVRLNYDPNGQLVSIIDPKGRERFVTRDSLGNITAVKNPEGGTTAQAYDQFFRVSNVTDALGRGFDYQYNSLDLPTQIQGPVGTTHLTYDELGRTTSITDANGNLTRFLYDPATGDLLSTLQGIVESRYTYDRFGNLTSTTDPNGVVTAFQYDALNRLIRSGNARSANFEIVGTKTKVTDGTNAVVHVEANKALQHAIVKYRPQGGGTFKVFQASDVLSNLVNFNVGDLQPNTVYEYTVEGTDLLGNQATFPMQTFQTPNLSSSSPLVLTNRVESTGLNSAAIAVNLVSGTFVGNAVLRVIPSSGGTSIVMNQSIIPDANNMITVSGLNPDTEYVYTLFAQNLVGNSYFPVTTKPILFRTRNPNDYTAPVVLTNQITSISSQNAFLNLTTDEPLARVHLTLTPTEGGAPIEIDYYTPEKGKELAITNLLPDKDYSYVLTLTDFSGNSVTTQAQTFKTSVLESDPPEIIYEAPVEVKSDQATVRIETDEPLSRVILILLPADTLIPQEFNFGGSSNLIREFTLTGLRSGVDYYYLVYIIDASGNLTLSGSRGEFHTRVL